MLGEAVGKSRAHITNMLRVLKLPVPVLSMVRDGSLSMGHAKALLNHADPVKGAKVILDKDLSVRQTEEMISQSGADVQRRAAEQAAAGAQAGCRGRGAGEWVERAAGAEGEDQL